MSAASPGSPAGNKGGGGSSGFGSRRKQNLRIYSQEIDPDKERAILSHVIAREEALSVIQQNFDLYRLRKPWSRHKVVASLFKMQLATLNIVEGILLWRKALVHPEPFNVCGKNYLIKLIRDTSFLQKFSDMKREFGFDIGKKNPFCLPIRASWSEEVKASLAKRRRPPVDDDSSAVRSMADTASVNSMCSDHSSFLARNLVQRVEDDVKAAIAAANARREQEERERRARKAAKEDGSDGSGDSWGHRGGTHNKHGKHDDDSDAPDDTSVLTFGSDDSREKRAPQGVDMVEERQFLSLDEYKLICAVIELSTVPAELQSRMVRATKALHDEATRLNRKVEGRWAVQLYIEKPYRPPPYAYRLASLGPPMPPTNVAAAPQHPPSSPKAIIDDSGMSLTASSTSKGGGTLTHSSLSTTKDSSTGLAGREPGPKAVTAKPAPDVGGANGDASPTQRRSPRRGGDRGSPKAGKGKKKLTPAQLTAKRFKSVPRTLDLRVKLGVAEPPRDLTLAPAKRVKRPQPIITEDESPHKTHWRKARHGKKAYTEESPKSITQRLKAVKKTLREYKNTVLDTNSLALDDGSSYIRGKPPSPSRKKQQSPKNALKQESTPSSFESRGAAKVKAVDEAAGTAAVHMASMRPVVVDPREAAKHGAPPPPHSPHSQSEVSWAATLSSFDPSVSVLEPTTPKAGEVEA